MKACCPFLRRGKHKVVTVAPSYLPICSVLLISLQDSSFPVGSPYEIGNTYWTPSLKEEEIYIQMSRWNYREIPHNLITLSNPLGEGQFGEVYQAEWEIPQHGHVNVAVKVVKKGAPREERLKLLQEAAILGQFRHRHIVSLLGVVTLGEPVSGWIQNSFVQSSGTSDRTVTTVRVGCSELMPFTAILQQGVDTYGA